MPTCGGPFPKFEFGYYALPLALCCYNKYILVVVCVFSHYTTSPTGFCTGHLILLEIKT